MCPGDFDAEITNSIFSRNSAADNGGAIVLNAIDEATINNCTFKSNSAGEGGAVYIKSSELITISNSRFEANIASNGSAILNDGELVLSNNTINKADAEIYNGQGLIDSALKIIIFANQTISAQIGDVLTLNATFMDDNGNLIYDPYFRFSVNGEDLEEIDCADGLYLCSYEVDSAGEKIISTTYDFGEIDLLISIIKVPKLHVKSEDLVIPEFTINPRPVFSINLSKYVTGTFRIIIDEDEYSEVLTNGSASITSSKLSLGKHNVTVIYSDDDNYVPYFNNTNLTILIESRLDNVVIPKLTNNPEPVFSITMPDEATGTLIVDVNGNEYSAPLVNGSAEVKVPKLDDGEYNITVTYTGDGKYSSVTKSSVMTVFNLKPYPEFSQNGNAEIVYSNDYVYKVLLTFNRKPAAGQTVDIIFNGITYKCVTDNSGYASLKINTKLTANEYAITARYGNIEVSNKIKINHLIKASVKLTKSKTLKVVVTLNKVNGKVLKSKKVKLVLKGKKYFAKTNKKAVATFKISKKALSKFKKGKTYNCQVSYDGDKIIKKFKIKKWRLINL